MYQFYCWCNSALANCSICSYIITWWFPRCWWLGDIKDNWPGSTSQLLLLNLYNALRHAHCVTHKGGPRCDKTVSVIGWATFNSTFVSQHALAVSWCLTSLFSTNIWLYQGWKVGWRVIPTQYRKASDILTSTLAAFLFSSHPKRERDREAHLNYDTRAKFF